MRRTVLVLALGALMALAGSTAAFAAVPTTLTAKYNASTEFFHGSVKSTNAECRAGRVVNIYKQKPGTDSLQGKTMAKANGTWRIRGHARARPLLRGGTQAQGDARDVRGRPVHDRGRDVTHGGA